MKKARTHIFRITRPTIVAAMRQSETRQHTVMTENLKNQKKVTCLGQNLFWCGDE